MPRYERGWRGAAATTGQRPGERVGVSGQLVYTRGGETAAKRVAAGRSATAGKRSSAVMAVVDDGYVAGGWKSVLGVLVSCAAASTSQTSFVSTRSTERRWQESARATECWVPATTAAAGLGEIGGWWC